MGNYFDATDEKTFQKVLGVVVSQALDNTTAQINLLDIYNMHQLEFCKNDKASGQELDILPYCFAEIR